MICTACSAEIPDDDLFCDSCGAAVELGELPVVACPCASGEAEADEEGFCVSCGRRLRRPASDHMEQAVSDGFAAVSDRGLRHDRNEDRFAIAERDEGFALVVCDGVSSTRHAEDAAATVAAVVLEQLVAAIESGPPADGAEVMRAAIRSAGAALQAPEQRLRELEEMPSTTVVAALVCGGQITVGWAGDSRAYWMDGARAGALTEDHSWLREVVAAGELSEEDALRAPAAHAITRWLGADAGEHAEPEVRVHPIRGAGTLLLCTDGLWNYAAGEGELAALVHQAEEADTSALATARWLVGWANDQGGRDNITVALLQLPQGGEPDSANGPGQSSEPNEAAEVNQAAPGCV